MTCGPVAAAIGEAALRPLQAAVRAQFFERGRTAERGWANDMEAPIRRLRCGQAGSDVLGR
jgi:hypothetical protein